MPRLLPWAVDGASRKNRERNPAATPTPARTPSRREGHRTPSPQPASHNATNDAEIPSAVETTPRHIDVLRSSRSPPTSPVESPPTEEYIREGFDNDDMYIMVEDEFYAAAQQFTRHLHHAEYVRRRKQARRMDVSVLRDMERATDGKTAMSEEVLRRKEAERLRNRQKQGLTPRTRRPRTEEEEAKGLGMLSEEEGEDDPWYGTSLHGLMASTRKTRSLVGLQGIRSSTRAAAGFRSAELATVPPINDARRSNLFISRSEQQETANGLVAAPELSSDEDDDLEIIESSSSRPNRLPQSDILVRTSLIKRESPEREIKAVLQRRVTISGDQAIRNRNSHEARISANENTRDKDTNHTYKTAVPRRHTDFLTNNNKPRKRIFLDDLDDFASTVDIKSENEDTNNDLVQDQPGRSLSTITKESRPSYRTSDQQQQKTAKRSRLNDIPTFLV